jgi:hypothetical protein
MKTLKEDNGVMVVEEEGLLKAFVANYFSSLFTPMQCADIQRVLNCETPHVIPQMNALISSEYFEEEVKKALDNVGDLKGRGA